MKKQSLFAKAMETRRQQEPPQEIQQSQAFPDTFLLVNKKEMEVETQKQVIEPSISSDQKANYHNLPIGEYSKIEEENLKLLASMDEAKILALQQEIQGSISNGLINMFKSGKIYQQPANQINQPKPDILTYHFKEILEEQEPNSKHETEDKLTQLIERQLRQEVDTQIKNNPDDFKAVLSDNVSSSLLDSYNFTLPKSFNIVDKITLKELKELLETSDSKGSLVTFFMILQQIFQQFIKEFEDNNGDFITINDVNINRLELIQYFESNILIKINLKGNFQLTDFLLFNTSKLFTNVNSRVLDLMDLWFGFLVYKPWSYGYDLLEIDQQNQNKYINNRTMLDQLKLYSNKIKDSSLFSQLELILLQVNISMQRSYYICVLLTIIRVCRIISKDLVQEIKGLKQIIEKSVLQNETIDFNTFMQINILNVMDQKEYSYSYPQGRRLNIDFNNHMTYGYLFYFNKRFLCQQNSFNNILISQLSKGIKDQLIQSKFMSVVKHTFLLYDRWNNSNLISNMKFPDIIMEKSYNLNSGNQYFKKQMVQIIPSLVAFQFETIIQDIEYVLSNNEFPINQLGQVVLLLQQLKFQSKYFVSKKMRKRYLFATFDQIRSLYVSIILDCIKAKVNEKSFKGNDILYLLIQLMTKSLGIVLSKNDQKDQILFHLESFYQGLYNLLYFNESLTGPNLEEVINEIQIFMNYIVKEKYSTIEFIDPMYLLLRYYKFLCQEGNHYERIDQKTQVEFLQWLINNVELSGFAKMININVSYFEKLLQKYTYDTFNSLIFTNIMFMFALPYFKADIHKQNIYHNNLQSLILLEFSQNGNDLKNLEIHLTDKFNVKPEYAKQHQFPLTLYKQYCEKIKSKQITNTLLDAWLDKVQQFW